MAMTNRANIKRDGLIMSTLDDLVPQSFVKNTGSYDRLEIHLSVSEITLQ